MSTTSVLVLAFAIGMVAGLRSMTAPAVVSWAAHWKWLNLDHSVLGFLASTAAVYILTAGALIELVVDKLPMTPSRTAPLGLIARLVLGGLSGAALCASANQSIVRGAILGGLGGIAGGFAGYNARTKMGGLLKVPDPVVAVLEDAIAISAGFFIVSRFV